MKIGSAGIYTFGTLTRSRFKYYLGLTAGFSIEIEKLKLEILTKRTMRKGSQQVIEGAKVTAALNAMLKEYIYTKFLSLSFRSWLTFYF